MQRLYPAFFCLFLFFALFSLASIDAGAQSCNGADGVNPVAGGLTQITNGEICANKGGTAGQMKIEAYNVDDGGVPSSVAFEIDWNDGSALEVVTSPVMTHPSANAYAAVVSHLFPPNGASVKCEYFPTVRLRINGAACSSTLGIPPRFVRYNVEGQNTGVLRLSETNTNVTEYLVCRGVTSTVTFTDRSTLNCVPPALASNTNNSRRWRRFTYGTVNTITSATGVLLNGTANAYPAQGGGGDITGHRCYSSNVTLDYRIHNHSQRCPGGTGF